MLFEVAKWATAALSLAGVTSLMGLGVIVFESLKWATALLSLVGVWLNVRRNRACFFVWMASNAGWCAVDCWHGIWAQGCLHACYFGMAVWGAWAWKGG